MKTNIYKEYVPTIGKRLFNLALKWADDMPATKKARMAAISAVNGRKKIKGGVRAAEPLVTAAAKAIITVRAKRTYNPKQGRYRKLPMGTLQERLQKRIEFYVWHHLTSLYRYDSAGKVVVKLSNDTTDVKQFKKEDWDYYPKSYKYPKIITNTVVTVSRKWLTAIRKNGFSAIDGKLVLSAEFAYRKDGKNVFSATVLTQGRGYKLRVEKMYICQNRYKTCLVKKLYEHM